MYANSSKIVTNQETVHPHLATVVAKHAATEFLKPILQHNRIAFEKSIELWQASGARPLILDAGCGVGLSTRHLAVQFPDHFVIGVDQSAHRLSRNTIWTKPMPPNFIQVRADLVDYWRLMHNAQVKPARHYVLYPNPWPKIGQLARRWHGHAVFPTMLALGGRFECRSNWQIYIDECASALKQLTSTYVTVEHYITQSPITPFEQKYIASGHALWRCTANLDAAENIHMVSL